MPVSGAAKRGGLRVGADDDASAGEEVRYLDVTGDVYSI